MMDLMETLDTSLIMTGAAFEWSPDTVGEYPYFCMVHPWMQGVIIVQEVGASFRRRR